jgi:hypothetical protein
LPKLKLAVALPLGHLLLAAGLFQWAYRVEGPMYVSAPRLICRGLNAPAQLFGIIGAVLWTPDWDLLPHSMLGFDSGDLVFLVGVILVWWLVGRSLDQRAKPTRPLHIGQALLTFLPLLTVAAVLFIAGLEWARRPWENLGYGAQAVLSFAWSACLASWGGMIVARAIRRRHHQI